MLMPRPLPAGTKFPESKRMSGQTMTAARRLEKAAAALLLVALGLFLVRSAAAHCWS